MTSQIFWVQFQCSVSEKIFALFKPDITVKFIFWLFQCIKNYSAVIAQKTTEKRERYLESQYHSDFTDTEK